jgi:hypothetical protein
MSDTDELTREDRAAAALAAIRLRRLDVLIQAATSELPGIDIALDAPGAVQSCDIGIPRPEREPIFTRNRRKRRSH